MEIILTVKIIGIIILTFSVEHINNEY